MSFKTRQEVDNSKRSGPLRSMRVVEIGSIGPAPFAAMMLADMGADVIRIERHDPGPIVERGPTVRGRRTVWADLKDPSDKTTVQDLIDQCDVLIEGFRPGAMERLGLGPETVLSRNPRLVYARMTGWGQDGPLSQTAGHDINYISLSGALHAMGSIEHPPPVPLNLVGDYGGGALYLVSGILAAYIEAQSSGSGQVVDVAICDASVSLMSLFHQLQEEGEWLPQRHANQLDGAAPFYRTYACKDGRYLAVGALEPQFYAIVRKLAGWDDACFDRQYDRSRWPEMSKRAEKIMQSRTRDEWVSLFAGTDACVSPVLDLQESRNHPHLQSRGCMVQVGEQLQPAPAPRFSRTPSNARASVFLGDVKEINALWSKEAV